MRCAFHVRGLHYIHGLGEQEEAVVYCPFSNVGTKCRHEARFGMRLNAAVGILPTRTAGGVRYSVVPEEFPEKVCTRARRYV